MIPQEIIRKKRDNQSLSKEEITDLLDPDKYTGLCSYFAEEYSKKALGLANQLEE